MENEVAKIYSIEGAKDALTIANLLKEFVAQQSLTVDIQGKPYPLIEAWQFAGAHFGLYPILVELKNESSYEPVTFQWADYKNNPREKKTFRYKYRATVEIRRHSDDKVMSRGEMVCDNAELKKHTFDEYAIQSMAQTRAEGKAWRMLIGWVFKAAGFEATPFEEMDNEQREFYDNCPTPEEKRELIKLAYTAKMDSEEKRVEAMAMISGCTEYDLFRRIESRLKDLQPSIHEIANPSQAQINEHLKKSIKREPATN